MGGVRALHGSLQFARRDFILFDEFFVYSRIIAVILLQLVPCLVLRRFAQFIVTILERGRKYEQYWRLSITNFDRTSFLFLSSVQ